MSLFGLLYIFFFNTFLKMIAEAETTGDLDFVRYDMFINGIDVCNEVYNIFAWVDVFIDVDFLLNLFLLSSLYYALKFAIRVAKLIIGFFK